MSETGGSSSFPIESKADGASWSLALEGMPQFDVAMQRVYAWYANEIIDRAPVRFIAHNAQFDNEPALGSRLSTAQLRERWFDAEYQVDQYIRSIAGKRFHGETFPVFYPNLGPDVYAAFYGTELTFHEVTSWSSPVVHNWEDMEGLALDMENAYMAKLNEITRCALEQCDGQFMVGYTDLHPGVDCAMAWRGSQQLCIDLITEPEQVRALIDLAIKDFERIYDHFDAVLKAANQLSVSWLGVPSFDKMHIPSCDFSAMISPTFFADFCLPVMQREVAHADQNVYHVDGPGVANHLDFILAEPRIQAIQWVQGQAEDRSIMQWVTLIERVQTAGKSIIVDLQPHELDPFMAAVEPKGIYLWISADDEEEQLRILERVKRWT